MEKFLEFMKNDLVTIAEVSLKELGANKDNTALIIVDMVKGFYNIGALANEKVGNIISDIVRLDKDTKDYKKVFFIDSHEDNAREFKSYPAHCIAGSVEEELVDELLNSESLKNKNTIIVKKNSINGFHCKEIKEIVDDEKIKNIIVVGVCTDICVKNFVMTAVTYLNQYNLEKDIIVPANMVETFDADFHNREYWNLTSLFEMKANGVKIIKDII
ncbi:isochorismatase family cysteine hydrolase [uncultured Clostridium sp.]|jgi:nicotinamidase-related amidase|uniref:cysteine hydrolase family protein n=1 Tax=uncultured Clostridium sp. TaxID=59620 RepID=UPI00262ADEB3|nr:isochorismatase family cysteine hydrolase [uncultured Clostridium sp.]